VQQVDVFLAFRRLLLSGVADRKRRRDWRGLLALTSRCIPPGGSCKGSEALTSALKGQPTRS